MNLCPRFLWCARIWRPDLLMRLRTAKMQRSQATSEVRRVKRRGLSGGSTPAPPPLPFVLRHCMFDIGANFGDPSKLASRAARPARRRPAARRGPSSSPGSRRSSGRSRGRGARAGTRARSRESGARWLRRRSARPWSPGSRRAHGNRHNAAGF
jgi:hypothetical protein